MERTDFLIGEEDVQPVLLFLVGFFPMELLIKII